MKFIFVIFALLLQPVYAEETGAVLLENLPSNIEIFVKNELKSQKGNTHAIITLPVGSHQLELRRNGQAFQTVDVEIIKDKLIPKEITPPDQQILEQLYVTKMPTEFDKEFIERRQTLLDQYNQETQKRTVNYQAGIVEIKEDNFNIKTNTLNLSINWLDWVKKHHSVRENLLPEITDIWFTKLSFSRAATIAISREQLKEMLKEGSYKSVFIYFKLDNQPPLKKTTIVDKAVLTGLNQEWLIKPLSGQLTIAISPEFQTLVEKWRDGFNKNSSNNVHINIVTASLDKSVEQLTDELANFVLLFRQQNKEYPSFEIFEKKYNHSPAIFDIGKGAIVIYAHKANPLFNLTRKNIDSIFSKNEKKLCGGTHNILFWSAKWDSIIKHRFNWELKSHSLEDKSIQLMGSPLLKDSFEVLAKQLLLCGGDFKSNLETKETSEQVLSAISENVEMLGYANWFDKIASTKQGVKQITIDGVEATKANILTDRYPYGYYISFLANKPKDKKLAPLEEEFLKFVRSKEGQTILEEAGFIALPVPK
ncbi:MAG: phosphate transporter substrate-binding protein PstS family protein [Pseudomonadota bacterium]